MAKYFGLFQLPIDSEIGGESTHFDNISNGSYKNKVDVKSKILNWYSPEVIDN